MDTRGDLIMEMHLCASWNATAMAWYPDEYNGLRYLQLNWNVWTPVLTSASDVFVDLNGDTMFVKDPVMLVHLGAG